MSFFMLVATSASECSDTLLRTFIWNSAQLSGVSCLYDQLVLSVILVLIAQFLEWLPDLAGPVNYLYREI